MANNEKKFEDELKDLEAIVARIDSGELSLEESLSAFERGVKLVKSLNNRLDEVEKKVELLVRNSRGDLTTAAIDPAQVRKNGNDDDDVPF